MFPHAAAPEAGTSSADCLGVCGKLERKVEMKGAGGLFRSWKWRLASLNFGMGELNYDSDTIDAERIKGYGTVVGVEDVADNKGHRSNRFNIKVRPLGA